MDSVQLIVVNSRVTTMWTPSRVHVGGVVWVPRHAVDHLLGTGAFRLPEVTKPLTDDEIVRRTEDPTNRFSYIVPAWEGQTVLCVAGGSSVTAEQIAPAMGRVRTLVVNNAYLLAPWADVLYFADTKWWRWHSDGTPTAGLDKEEVARRYAAFPGTRITIENTGRLVEEERVHVVKNLGRQGLSGNPHGIHTGSNGGYQAINIAVLAGAKKILLAGYDMRFIGGKSHWHGDHPAHVAENAYTRYAKNFASMNPELERKGIDVVNCTPESAIKAFRFSTLEEEL